MKITEWLDFDECAEPPVLSRKQKKGFFVFCIGLMLVWYAAGASVTTPLWHLIVLFVVGLGIMESAVFTAGLYWIDPEGGAQDETDD